MPATLTEIAALLDARLTGPDTRVEGVATLEEAGPSQLTLCTSRRWVEQLRLTKAAAVIVAAKASSLMEEAPCPVLLVEDPRKALAQVMDWFHPPPALIPGVAPDAWVDPGARIDQTARIETGARIEAGAVVGARTKVEFGASIGPGASIGEDCHIGIRAVVYGVCTLGKRVRLGAGAVIGSLGFGFARDGQAYRRIPQVGCVVIGDDVEIGAGTTVDRGTLGTTRIGEGTKIDNLVQVGHNVVIGKHVVIAAQTGLSGSVTIGDGAILGGQVGVADHVTIGTGAEVGAKSGVGSNVPEGARVAGYPAMPVQEWLSSVFLWRRLRRRRAREDQAQ